MPIKGRVLLLAVLVWQLPRIIEALKVPLPMATTVTTELRDGQGKPTHRHRGSNAGRQRDSRPRVGQDPRRSGCSVPHPAGEQRRTHLAA